MAKTPNYLFIITDQHRADHLGCYGNTVVKTPNIDALAARGTCYDRFYVANPVCMCNRASILTGRMPSLHGVRHNGIPLSVDSTTFVALLRARGYRTALIGKSHIQNMTGVPASLRYEPEDGFSQPPEELQEASKRRRIGNAYTQELSGAWQRDPAHQVSTPFYGFDYVRIANQHADLATGDYYVWLKEQCPQADTLRGRDNAQPDDRYDSPQAWRTRVPEELYSTTYVGNETAAFIENHVAADSGDPFFAMMSFPDPHHPFTPPGRYWDMYDPASMTLPPSFGLGDIPPLAALRRARELNQDNRGGQDPFVVSEREAREIIALTYGSISMIDTVVGQVLAKLEQLGVADDTIVCFTSDHGDFMGDHGLMLKLLMHYQGLIRVPFIWSDPTTAEGPDRVDGLASSIDIAPTILRRAGIQPYIGIQGRDLLERGHEERQGLIVEEDSQRTMVGFDKPQRIRTYVDERWRMTVRHTESWGELFDLENDPHELHNLWDDPGHVAQKSILMEAMLYESIALQDRSPLPTYMA
jgi:arylsulfatase A-like enzyme